VTFFRDRVHGRSPDCCSVPNRENLVFRRLPLEADEVINDLEEKGSGLDVPCGGDRLA
jgi:hypothetical protein